jgi:hypothetical protein
LPVLDPKVPRLCLHVDTARTDHHPNNPSRLTCPSDLFTAPDDRALALRECLDSAAAEDLSASTTVVVQRI